MEKEVLTIKQAAEALEVSPATIRRRIKSGQLKAEMVEGIFGPQWVIDPDDLTRASQNIEVIPVKHNMSPDKLEDLIVKATAAAAKEGTKEAMQEYQETIKALAESVQTLYIEVEQLRKEKEQAKNGLFSRLFKNK